MESTTESAKITLKQLIDADMKSAMLQKDNVKRDLLRVIKAEISREEAGIKTYSDDDVIRLIKKSIKNLETINSEEAKAEIAILSQYIPQQFTEAEIEAKVKEEIALMGNVTMKEMGKVIAAFNSKYKGLADGKMVSDMVKKMLS